MTLICPSFEKNSQSFIEEEIMFSYRIDLQDSRSSALDK